MKNYPFRSLYVDDNHPFADKNSTKSISLIQNWDSISDKEFFEKINHHFYIDFQIDASAQVLARERHRVLSETIKSQRRLSLQILKLIDVQIVF